VLKFVGTHPRPIRITAFHLLQRVMSHLTEVDENTASPSPDMATSDDSNDYRELPFRLVELLTQSQAVVAELFAEFDFGESVPVPSGTAAYDCLTSYLLSWRLILTLVGGASSELRPKYSEFIRRESFMETLMPALFHLMPHGSSDAATKAFVAKGPRLEAADVAAEDDELQLLACSVFYLLLKQLPAMVGITLASP
jgi:hypothetical protein